MKKVYYHVYYGGYNTESSYVHESLMHSLEKYDFRQGFPQSDICPATIEFWKNTYSLKFDFKIEFLFNFIEKTMELPDIPDFLFKQDQLNPVWQKDIVEVQLANQVLFWTDSKDDIFVEQIPTRETAIHGFHGVPGILNITKWTRPLHSAFHIYASGMGTKTLPRAIPLTHFRFRDNVKLIESDKIPDNVREKSQRCHNSRSFTKWKSRIYPFK